MKKYFSSLMFFIVLNLLYFSLFSYHLYNKERPFIVLSLYFVIGFALFFWIGMYNLNKNRKNRNSSKLQFPVLSILVFVIFTFWIDSNFGFILHSYYSKGYKTIFEIKNYVNSDDTNVILYNTFKDNGYSVDSINLGYDKSCPIIHTDLSSTQLTYNISNDHIVILDFDTKKILKSAPMLYIKDKCIELLSSDLSISKTEIKLYEYAGCCLKFKTKDRQYSVYVYSNNGDFSYFIFKM